MDNSIQITSEQKDEIYSKLADAMIDGLENGTLSPQDSEVSSQYILEQLGSITTRAELLTVLEDVSNRWSSYKTVYFELKEEDAKKQDTAQIEQAQQELQSIQQ